MGHHCSDFSGGWRLIGREAKGASGSLEYSVLIFAGVMVHGLLYTFVTIHPIVYLRSVYFSICNFLPQLERNLLVVLKM